MAKRFMSMRNLKFTMHELIGKKLDELGQPQDKKDIKSIDMIFSAAFEFANDALHPLFEEMDRNPPELVNGAVKVNPSVRKILKILGKDGWLAATFPDEWGGENMSTTVFHAINFIFSASNYSATVYQELTIGAARLIYTFGSEKLKKTYLPSMLEGKWQGTMALTEPEAGSSLGDIKTSAVQREDGAYNIKGEKIFISAGDHDGVDNIIHLMLGRIKGAPTGVKGISLFVVPKLRINENGDLVDNDIKVNQIFHKLGYKGSPITGLNMGDTDDCIGYQVGEPNKGLLYMFQMMNGARLDVGTGATGIATAAYHASLDYVRERRQGRKITEKKSPKQVLLIEHPDVKRMLLFQRAITEGSLALILLCGHYDELIHGSYEKQKEEYKLLLEILIPVAKTFPAEMSIISTSMSIQCFGGYGYCDDFPVEQHFRDTRIHPIHEGSTGIQGMDLLGRKITMSGGKALNILLEKINQTVEEAKQYPECQSDAEDLSAAITMVQATTKILLDMKAKDGDEAFLANATIYLEMFGLFIIGWLWLDQAIVSWKQLSRKSLKKSEKNFYEGKTKVNDYYFSNELPKIYSLSKIMTRKFPVTLSTGIDHFTN